MKDGQTDSSDSLSLFSGSGDGFRLTFFGDVAILVACPVSRWRNSLTVVHLACLAAEPLEIWVQIQASVACRYMQATLSKINISGRPVYS